ncbi:MAG: hypothetical protein QGF20_04990 [Alphaproteobacteria bacterium]|mgnify:CR=1 FL=1|nr:hypothetical protein [Alphaproteobacteria bacterium]
MTGHIQDAMYGERRYFGDVRSTDLEVMAQATGMPYWKVDKVAGFGPPCPRPSPTPARPSWKWI